MKKLLYFVCTALTVVALSACVHNEVPGGGGKNDPTKRKDPWLEISVKALPTSAAISVTPHNVDENETYFTYLMPLADYEEFFGTYKSTGNDALIMEGLDGAVQQSINAGLYEKEILYKGEQNIPFTGLTATTEYVFLAVFCDIDMNVTHLTAEVFRTKFITKIANYQELNFTFNFNSPSGDVTITPSDLKRYYVFVCSPSHVHNGQYKETGNSIDEYLEWNIIENCANAMKEANMFGGQFTVADFAEKGVKKFNLITDEYDGFSHWSNYCTVGQSYNWSVAAAGVDKEGYRNSDISTHNLGNVQYR